MICAAVALANIRDLDDAADDVGLEYEDADLYESGAGWLIFLAVMCMVVEPLIIIARFLNFSFVNENFLIFAIIVSVISIHVHSFAVYCRFTHAQCIVVFITNSTVVLFK